MQVILLQLLAAAVSSHVGRSSNIYIFQISFAVDLDFGLGHEFLPSFWIMEAEWAQQFEQKLAWGQICTSTQP